MRPNLDIARRRFIVDSKGNANIADTGNTASKAISAALFRRVGATGTAQTKAAGQRAGVLFEEDVAILLSEALSAAGAARGFRVERKRLISQFAQYKHFADVNALIRSDTSGQLRSAIGGEYFIKPDVVVSLPFGSGAPFLHAAVSLKWTLRSDRAQNIRHEANSLLRHRNGRAPHIVAVTAEPLPSRISSIALGMGELDCVYHLVLHELRDAVEECGSSDMLRDLDHLKHHGRLADLSELPGRLLL